jgi:hypothetical protein
MSTIYSSEAFRDYAQRQIDCADIFLSIHAEAGLSLCRCGRLHPCDDRRYWLDLQARYRRSLEEVVPPPGTATTPAMLDPGP